jgi:hypothetical protein
MSLNPPVSFWQVAAALANGLHAPRTVSVLKALAAWSYCEKPHTGAAAWQWNNPLNTTEPGFGSTATVNAVGVRIYPTPADGIAATVATLTNGFYPGIVTALRAGNGATAVRQTGEIATWGTDPSCVATNFAALAPPPSTYLMQVTTQSAPGPTQTTPAAFAITTGTGTPSVWWWVGGAGVVVAVGAVAAGPRLRTAWDRMRQGSR